MIIVKLQGGLGNQLFQYAACRQLALKNNTLLFFDTTLLEYSKQSDTKRKFELGVYNIRAGVADKVLLEKVKKKFGVKNKISRFFRFLNPAIYNEPHFHFDPFFLKLKKDTIVNGYLQSEKYFKGIEKLIRQELVLNKPVSSKTVLLQQEMDKVTAVSIHIRRGDYVNNEATLKAHGTCSMEYYQKAVSIIAAKVDQLQLFIFSDDIDWVKNNFHSSYPVTFVGHNDAYHAYEDMYLMSCCHHNIIANSSFSWWGAWLNNNTSKIVVAPSSWFNEFDADTKDLLPAEWIKV